MYGGFHGALNWVPLMPIDASLSGELYVGSMFFFSQGAERHALASSLNMTSLLLLQAHQPVICVSLLMPAIIIRALFYYCCVINVFCPTSSVLGVKIHLLNISNEWREIISLTLCVGGANKTANHCSACFQDFIIQLLAWPSHNSYEKRVHCREVDVYMMDMQRLDSSIEFQNSNKPICRDLIFTSARNNPISDHIWVAFARIKQLQNFGKNWREILIGLILGPGSFRTRFQVPVLPNPTLTNSIWMRKR